MKSLTSFGAFARGAMIGLALNLSLLPMVQAQQTAAPRPGGPAEVVAVDPPSVIVVPTDPVDQLLSVQEEIYNALFTSTWNMLSSGFLLDEGVEGPGVVAGRSELGEPFELEAVLVAPTTPESLSPEVRERAMNAGIALVGVVGVLRRGPAAVPCEGLVISISDQESTRYEFFPVNRAEDDAVAVLLAPDRDLGTDPAPNPGDGPAVIVPDPGDGPSWSPECQECLDERNQKAREVEDAFNQEVASISSQYNDAVAAANEAYRNAAHIASAVYAAALAAASSAMIFAVTGCAPALLVSRIAFLICAARAFAAWAATAAIATFAYRAALAIAESNRNAAVSNAAAAASRAFLAAIRAYLDRLEEISRELLDCYQRHGCPVF